MRPLARKQTPLVGRVLAVSALSLTRLSRALTIWVIALAAVFLVVGPVAGLSSGSTAMASKKKCKKALWKCAPKHYWLEAEGGINYPTSSVNFHALIDMGLRRAGPGEVDYAQDRGIVVVDGTSTEEFSDLLPNCQSNVKYSVESQPIKVPRGGIYDTDFSLAFDLIGTHKNTYSLHAGETQPEASKIIGSGIVSCPADGSSAPFTYYFTGSQRLIPIGRGKLGKSSLVGSAGTPGGPRDWLQWHIWIGRFHLDT